MKRVVVGYCSLPEGAQLILSLCDAYLNPTGTASPVEVLADGAFVATLTLNENNTCWVIETTKRVPFWVKSGDGDLALEDALRPTNWAEFEDFTRVDNSLNFSNLLERYLRGEPIISLLEKSILSAYFKMADGASADCRLCKLEGGV